MIGDHSRTGGSMAIDASFGRPLDSSRRTQQFHHIVFGECGRRRPFLTDLWLHAQHDAMAMGLLLERTDWLCVVRGLVVLCVRYTGTTSPH